MNRGPRGYSREACRELDRRAIEEFGIPGLILMEHASLGAAVSILDRLERPASQSRVWIVCGPGNNGGDGFATARHLANAGVDVEIWSLSDPASPGSTSDAAVQQRIATRMGLRVVPAHVQLPPPPAAADMVVDAVFGTGLSRAPAGLHAECIRMLNAFGAPIVALDTPSGFDADSGTAWSPAVEAKWTVTFGLPKRGFFAAGAERFTGQVFYVPIGVPRTLLPAEIHAFPPAPRPLV